MSFLGINNRLFIGTPTPDILICDRLVESKLKMETQNLTFFIKKLEIHLKPVNSLHDIILLCKFWNANWNYEKLKNDK